MTLRTKPSRVIGIINPTVYYTAYEAAYAAAYHGQYTVDDAKAALEAAKAAYHRASAARWAARDARDAREAAYRASRDADTLAEIQKHFFDYRDACNLFIAADAAADALADYVEDARGWRVMKTGR